MTTDKHFLIHSLRNNCKSSCFLVFFLLRRAEKIVIHKSRILPQSFPSTKTRNEDLIAANTHDQGLQRETVPAVHKMRQWVLIVGDFLLKGSEVLICHSDRKNHCSFGELRSKMLPAECHKITECHSLLLFHVSMNGISTWNLGRIKAYKALRVQMKSFGVQVVSSSILPARWNGADRNICIMHIYVHSGFVAGDFTSFLTFMTTEYSAMTIAC